MYDPTPSMEVVQPKEDLFRNLSDDEIRDTTILIPFYQPPKVLSQHLERHADVGSVRTLVSEMIEERDYVPTTGVVWIGRRHFLEEFDLVQGRLGVVICTLDDLQRDVAIQPGKMNPAGGAQSQPPTTTDVVCDLPRLRWMPRWQGGNRSSTQNAETKTYLLSFANQTVEK